MDEPIILLSLEKEMQNAFQQFANYPTQSNRAKLRQKLLQIAGAMEVEAYNLPSEDAIPLTQAVENMRVLADTVLIAPKESLTEGLVPQIPDKAIPARAVKRAVWVAVALTVLRDVTKLFRK